MKKNIKNLSYIDTESQNIIKINCRLREEINEININNFKNSLYKTNVDFSLFKENKNLFNLEQEFCKILDDDIIDFGNIIAVYSNPTLFNTVLVNEPIKNLLSLFEIVDIEEKDLKDLEISEIVMRHHNFIGKIEREQAAREASSVRSNTLLFKDSSKEDIFKLFSKKEKFVKVKCLSSKRAIG